MFTFVMFQCNIGEFFVKLNMFETKSILRCYFGNQNETLTKYSFDTASNRQLGTK
jgi:hypothetical protein